MANREDIGYKDVFMVSIENPSPSTDAYSTQKRCPILYLGVRDLDALNPNPNAIRVVEGTLIFLGIKDSAYSLHDIVGDNIGIKRTGKKYAYFKGDKEISEELRTRFEGENSKTNLEKLLQELREKYFHESNIVSIGRSFVA